MTPQRRPSASSPPAGRTRATPRLSCRSRRSGLSGCRSSLYGCPWGRRRRTLPGGFRWPCSGSPPCRPRPPGPRQCRSGRGRRCGSTRSLALWCPRPSPLPILSWGRSRRSWDREPRRPAPVCPAEGLLHQAAGLLLVLFLRGHAALLPSPVFPDLYRPGSSFLGVALRLPGEVDPDVGLLSHDPGVVPRTDYVNVPRDRVPARSRRRGLGASDPTPRTPCAVLGNYPSPRWARRSRTNATLAPGWRWSAVTSSMLTMSTLPLSKVLVSSGDSTLLAFRDSESTVVRSAPSSHCASVGSQVLARGQDGTGRTPPRPNGLDSQ